MVTKPGLYVELDTREYWLRTGNRWFQLRTARWMPWKKPYGNLQRLIEPPKTSFKSTAEVPVKEKTDGEPEIHHNS